VLIGRSAERLRVLRAIDCARESRSDSLVIVGPPGAGKTALLRAAEQEAREFTVLRARGVELEAALPFAGLQELLRPVVAHADELAPRQARSLRAALALSDGPGDRFATYVGVLGLLAAAAEPTPVLCLIDDAHWLDDDSLEALLFSARRLEADAVALIFAVRSGAGHFAAAGCDELELRPLARPDAARLLSAMDPPLASDVVARLVIEGDGNPLALIESARGLTEGQRSGREPLLGPALAGGSGERLFGRRIAELSPGARRVLLLAAADQKVELGPVLSAASRLGISPAALQEAEAAGLLVIGEARISFVHPLIRSAAYTSAASSERRAAHAALADVLADDRRAWHLAAATFGPDDDVARALECAAATARQRGGFASAADLLDRAARLSEAPADCGRRLFLAAEAARSAGQGDRAADLLGETATMTTDPGVRIAIQHARGRVELLHGRTSSAQAILVATAGDIALSDPDLAATMLAEAAFAAMVSGDGAGALAIGGRAEALNASDGSVGRLIAGLVGGIARFRAGAVDQGLLQVARAAELAETSGDLEPEYLALAAHVLAWVGEYGRARHMLDRTTSQARAAGALGVLPWTLYVSADLDIRTARWAVARADATEAARIAGDTGNAFWRSYALACLAVLDAGQGREEDCRAHAEESEAIARVLGVEPPRKVGDARGLLELSLGRPVEAAIHFEAAGGSIATRLTLADYIEACVRARRDIPSDVLTALSATSPTGTALRGLVERCRGLIAENPDSERHLLDALDAYEKAEMPFGWARTALILGERLRREGRRIESRAYLRPALERFTRLEATPWAARTRLELRASGETVARRDDLDARDRLTPQELQVAVTVARGATNREAGAQLFISAKTVEYHLSHVYQKLRVRSRTELAHRLADDGALESGLSRPDEQAAGIGDRIHPQVVKRA
jgi:DNA-binding NarL/FixJ family response regulator/tetratricopeptide (TPR) repeat protein